MVQAIFGTQCMDAAGVVDVDGDGDIDIDGVTPTTWTTLEQDGPNHLVL